MILIEKRTHGNLCSVKNITLKYHIVSLTGRTELCDNNTLPLPETFIQRFKPYVIFVLVYTKKKRCIGPYVTYKILKYT